MTLPAALPYDVTGTLTLSFAPDAVNPADDPAIQFATGGRQVSFVFPANTLNARFSGSTPASFVSFQAGTVAGTLTFQATSQTAAVSASTTAFTIPRQGPLVRSLQVNNTANGTEVSITVLSTVREVTQLSLGFETQPEVRVSCGSAAGCTASGSRVTFDVKAIFDGWYTGDRTSGGLSKLRFPFSIRGSVEGRVNVTLRNSLGGLGVATFQIPSSR
jgi:hypothetical protein